MSFRPGLIFGSVFLVCLSMMIVLPMAVSHGAGTQPAIVAQAAAEPTMIPQGEAVVPVAPVEPTAIAVVEPTTASQIPSQANRSAPPEDEALRAFVASLQNGQADWLVGVYVPGVFALRVVEQPAGNDTFVSVEDGTVTRYGLPANSGVTALLAHNYLSGRDFIKMQAGQQVYLVFGDGSVARYTVTVVEFYQAHSPNDPHSSFTSLNGPNADVLTYEDLYRHMYTNTGTLVFQTCLEANGDLAWGRTFIIAQPG